ncbi:MAG: hypothetical protein AAGI24_17640 [Pseudomonadota bacterium]
MNSSTSTSDYSTSKDARRAWWLLPLLCGLLLPGYNWVQDYYGIFGQREDWRGVIPNERYRKYEAVLARRKDITTLLFGSSKAANIPFTRSLGNSAYNFAYSEGLPRDHLEVLQQLVTQLPALERVYIGVDEMAFLLDPSRHAKDYLRRQHPTVAGIPDWRFKLRYLFRPLSNTDAHYFSTARRERPQIAYEFDSTGRSLCPSCDADIEADPAAHAQQPFFRFPYNPPDQYGLNRLQADLTAILALLDEHHIETVLFLQPTFANNLRWQNLGLLEALKGMLATLAPFYDFLVYDPALENTLSFYDVVHFRPTVGQRIMDVLMAESSVGPGEFGHRVSQSTLTAHTAAVRGKLVGAWVPAPRYQQDREYAAWLASADFQRQALPESEATTVLTQTPAAISCQLDSVNRSRFKNAPVRIAEDALGMLELGGWAKLEAMGGTGFINVAEQGIFGKDQIYAMAAGLHRADVAQRFGESFDQVGFRGNADISELNRGNYRVGLRFSDATGQWFACEDIFRLVVL